MLILTKIYLTVNDVQKNFINNPELFTLAVPIMEKPV